MDLQILRIASEQVCRPLQGRCIDQRYHSGKGVMKWNCLRFSAGTEPG
jgi:hypothetical protein